MINAVEPPDLTGLPGFAPVDVSCNQAGALSDGQRSILYRRLAKDLIGTVLGATLVIISVVFTHQVGVGIVLGGFAIAWAAYKVSTFAASVHSGHVWSVDGDALRECVPDSDGPDQYYLHIASIKLDITKEIYLQIQDGGPYRVFYVDEMRHVVSAAPMPGWRPLAPLPAKRRRGWSIEIGL